MAEVKVIELLDRLKKSKPGISSEFNIFTALHIEYREVYICRFIGSILNDSTKARELFGKIVLEATDDFSTASIELEELIADDRRVDIVIKTENRIYPIEAKIYAGDQDKQLYDYWTYYHTEYPNDFPNSSVIYYLTPDGREPSDKSKGSLKQSSICEISFQDDICKWIENCLQENYECEKYRYVLEQFREVINIMTQNQIVIDTIFKSENKYDYINALKALYSAETSIAERLREEYIEETFNNSNIVTEYELRKPDKPAKKSGEKVVFEITRKINSDTIATICVDTNLYLRADREHKICKKLPFKHWNKEKWEYLYVNDKTNEINLRCPWESLSGNSGSDIFTNLKELLDSIQSC